jgi:hypothetical protein
VPVYSSPCVVHVNVLVYVESSQCFVTIRIYPWLINMRLYMPDHAHMNAYWSVFFLGNSLESIALVCRCHIWSFMQIWSFRCQRTSVLSVCFKTPF